MIAAMDPTFLPPPKYTLGRADQVYREAFRRAVEFAAYQRIPGDVMEFGTLNGFTARVLAELMIEIGHPGKLWLFDSFEGMPEATHSIDRGSYEIKAGAWAPGTPVARIEGVENLIRDVLMPILGADRLRIIKGWYKDTLLSHPDHAPSIVHIDCDLYESTIAVLSVLPIQDGQIILFDDWNSGRANPKLGERAALNLATCRGFTYEPWYSYGWHGQAVIIHR